MRSLDDTERSNLLTGVLFVAILLLAVVAVTLVVQQNDISSNQDKIAANQAEQKAAAYATCVRIQTLRDAVNLHSYTDYSHRLTRGGKAAAKELLYAPPTDCRAAQTHPNTYVTPKLVPFTQVACRFTVHDPRPAPLPVCPP